MSAPVSEPVLSVALDTCIANIAPEPDRITYTVGRFGTRITREAPRGYYLCGKPLPCPDHHAVK